MFALHARVHACMLVSVLRDAFTSKGREGGGEGKVHIVLVLIYAARPAFLLPRYRDLSAANYTFTPFLAPSTLEHRKTRTILLIPPLSQALSTPWHPGSKGRKHVRVPSSLTSSSGWLLSFELSRSILSRWVKNKPSLTSA